MKKIATIGALVLAVLVAGCATPTKLVIFKETGKMRWEPGQGPLVTELVRLPQKTIVEVATDRTRTGLVKTKFETDAEFKQRTEAASGPMFVVAPVTTTKETNCEAVFDHAKNSYQIKACLPFFASRAIVSETGVGSTFKLANAFDSREINRKIWNKYFLAASVTWADEFTMSKDAAKEFDRDLMAGLVVNNPSTTSACSLCNSRDLEDAAKDLARALGSKSTSDGWKDRAFKEGELLEDWNYTVNAGGMKELVVFRKSDQRVLYHVKFVLEEQSK